MNFSILPPHKQGKSCFFRALSPIFLNLHDSKRFQQYHMDDGLLSRMKVSFYMAGKDVELDDLAVNPPIIAFT